MISDARGQGEIPIGTVLIVALAAGAGGLFLAREPLQSERPKEFSGVSPSFVQSEIVPARLWQDPLQPIQGHWRGLVEYVIEEQMLPPSAGYPRTISQMQDDIASRISADPERPDNLLVMGVLLNDGQFASDAENRRRNRYALMSALTNSNYMPEDSESIGYFIAPGFSPNSQSSALATIPCEASIEKPTRCPLNEPLIRVGFEWFEKKLLFHTQRDESDDEDEQPELDTDFPKNVLVLWLNSRDFADEPLRHIALLFQTINRDVKNNSSNVEIALVGPPDSDFLQELFSQHVNHEFDPFFSSENYSRRIDGFYSDARHLFLEMATPLDDFPEIDPESDPPSGTSSDQPSPLDPDPRGLEFMAPGNVTELVLREIDGYLDFGLPIPARDSLRLCLQDPRYPSATWYDSALRCLRPTNSESSLDELDNIRDSDVFWQDTILESLSPYAETQYPVNTAQTIRTVAGGLLWIESLLLRANNYLDHGLPAPSDGASVRGCLTSLFATDQGPDSLIQEMGNCLRDGFTTYDLDPEWYTTVAATWLSENPGFDHRLSHSPTRDQPHSQDFDVDPLTTLSTMRVLSPQSTVPLIGLLGEGPPFFRPTGIGGSGESQKPSDAASDELLTDRLGIAEFSSMLKRDDEVLWAVIDELRARGLRCDRDIAVVSESDSAYGRLMYGIISQAVKAQGMCDAEYPTIHFYGYMRGVDGEVPGTNLESPIFDEKAVQSAENAPLSESLFFPAFETAVGPVQIDYIRRLADRIGRDTLYTHSRPLQAIGVFGTDYYDKQLILQALKERLPDVTYFTTDLDARLTDPDKYRWNRNLVVGSAYGLTWQDSGSFPCDQARTDSATPQGGPDAPEFRDSYQTSFYRAVRVAIRTEPSEPTPCVPNARVFEIGRSGAIDITRYSTPSRQLEGGTDSRLGWLQHSGDVDEEALRILVITSPLILLAMLSFRTGRRLSSERAPEIRRAYLLASGIAGFSAIFIARILFDWHDTNLEPFLLFEGLSAIPTLVIHWTTIIFFVCLVIIAFAEINQHMTKATSDLQVKDVDLRITANEWLRLVVLSRDAPWSMSIATWSREIPRSKKLQDKLDVTTLFRRYWFVGHWIPSFVRAARWTLIWTLVFVFATDQNPEPLLARSNAQPVEWLRIAAVFATLGAVFLCMDALYLARVFIRSLSSYDIVGWRKGERHLDRPSRRWKAIKLIARHTERLRLMIFLPFIVGFLLLVSHSTIFDAWSWKPSFVVVYIGFFGYVLWRTISFDLVARQARTIIRDDLDRYRDVQDDAPAKTRRAELTIERIDGIATGAFAPWTQSPVLQSIIFPSGGLGMFALLDALLR